MRIEIDASHFKSPLGEHIFAFLMMRQACGYEMRQFSFHFRAFDRFLCERRLQAPALSKELVAEWTARRPHETSLTQSKRITAAIMLSKFLLRRGIDAYVPCKASGHIVHDNFQPYIFSHEQMRRLFELLDKEQPSKQYPFKALVLRELFRVVYSCGLRAGEVAKLKLADTDLANGVLSIKQGKFRKDRLIPLTESLTQRLRIYVRQMPLIKDQSSPLFPKPGGGHYVGVSLYKIFRELIWRLRIPHGGRGKGPRLHDLRHTFAVHRLESWIKSHADLNAKLPLLSVYLGQVSIIGTQRYLRLTSGAFPEIEASLSKLFDMSLNRRMP